VNVEGSLSLPTGRLVVCDLPEACNGHPARSPYEGPTIACPPGAYEVVSSSLDDETDGKNRALVFVGLRFTREPPVRWEGTGKFDNDKARFASFVDAPGLAALRSEPDFFENFYFPWIDELLKKNKGVSEWWSLKRLEPWKDTNAFVFVGSEQGTLLDVFSGHDAAGRLCAVVVDMAPIASERYPDAEEDDSDLWRFVSD
jgi:hypothetical protein